MAPTENVCSSHTSALDNCDLVVKVHNTFLDLACCRPGPSLRRSKSAGDLPECLPEPLFFHDDADDKGQADTDTPVSDNITYASFDTNSDAQTARSLSDLPSPLGKETEVNSERSADGVAPSITKRQRRRQAQALARQEADASGCRSRRRRHRASAKAAEPSTSSRPEQTRTSHPPAPLRAEHDFTAAASHDDIAPSSAILNEIEAAEGSEQVLDFVMRIGAENLNLQEVVEALHTIGKLADVEQRAGDMGRDPRVLTLVVRLRVLATSSFSKPRILARMMWALGKVGAESRDCAAIVEYLYHAMPKDLEMYTSQDLSNLLWGLARVSSAPGARPWAEQTALHILDESGRRFQWLSSQCLANSLWAVAKLGLQGRSAKDFTGGFIAEACKKNRLRDFSTQGLANSLWAVARLQTTSADQAAAFCGAFAREATPQRFKAFMPQELSMTIWAMARIAGKGCSGGQSHGPSGNRIRRIKSDLWPEVEQAILDAVQEVNSRLEDFSPQGISNISWALVTLELLRHQCVHQFLTSAAQQATGDLRNYSPQAVANLCWALCRIDGPGAEQAVTDFLVTTAVRAEMQMKAFALQDLAGILSAMSHARLMYVPEVHAFATALVSYAASGDLSEIGTQTLLNMALSSARLGVYPEDLWPLAMRINEVFESHGAARSLNGIDHRQWREVRAHCGMDVRWDATPMERPYVHSVEQPPLGAVAWAGLPSVAGCHW